MSPIEIEELLAATHDADVKVRKTALLALCPCHVRANRPAIWDRVFQMSNDVDAGVRSIVLHNLCDGSPRDREESVVEAVEWLANDPDKKVRRRARKALAVYRRTGVINSE